MCLSLFSGSNCTVDIKTKNIQTEHPVSSQIIFFSAIKVNFTDILNTNLMDSTCREIDFSFVITTTFTHRQLTIQLTYQPGKPLAYASSFKPIWICVNVLGFQIGRSYPLETSHKPERKRGNRRAKQVCLFLCLCGAQCVRE